MAGSVPEHVIQQIARSADVVRLAGRYCDLKKKGRSFWGLCPFHKEKTPSFSVDPEKGLFYCFGCKEGGNAFTLLQKLEGLSFGEALRQLAREAGVDLSQYRGETGPSGDRMARLREVNELATSFYQKCLQKAKGSKQVREYLRARQISDESTETWRLGFAPDGWEHLLKCALGRGYESDVVVEAGLALPRQGAPGHYDRFRNRLMFPIADAAGRTIGFGARALRAEDEPKYLNSPETPLFAKGRCFFGLSQAREAIRTGKTAVVLEGYTDVIMAHQAGVREAVAVLGTALTEDHARTLGRLCERVVLVFDADEAGQKSAMRSIEVLLNTELGIRVASLPAGQDPCDYILAEGGDAFRRRLEESVGFFEFRMAAARRDHDTDTIEGRTAAFREVAPLALLVRDRAKRDLVVRGIARDLGVRESHAWTYVQGLQGRTAGPRAAGPEGELSAQGALSAERIVPGELLGLLLEHPGLIPQAAGRLDAAMLRDCPERRLLERLLKENPRGTAQKTRRLLESLGEPKLAEAASRAVADERVRAGRITMASPEERLRGYLGFLEDRKARAASVAELGALDDAELEEIQRRLRDRDRNNARTG